MCHSVPEPVQSLIGWIRDRLKIDVYMEPRLPPPMHGLACWRPAPDGHRGYILLDPKAPDPRRTLLHEVGHFETGAFYSPRECVEPTEASATTERLANAWAAGYLTAMDRIAALAEGPRAEAGAVGRRRPATTPDERTA